MEQSASGSASGPDSPDFTEQLIAWRGGDSDALERLTAAVYDELRGVAQRQMRSERNDHTLQATALVHEAFARLIQAEVEVQDRVHFFALAARTMRRVLVDHARGKNRQRRGGGAGRVDLDDLGTLPAGDDEALLELDRALDDLRAQDPRKVEVVELIYFGGLTYAETADILEVSEATIDRELRFAKAWLARELRAD